MKDKTVQEAYSTGGKFDDDWWVEEEVIFTNTSKSFFSGQTHTQHKHCLKNLGSN